MATATKSARKSATASAPESKATAPESAPVPTNDVNVSMIPSAPVATAPDSAPTLQEALNDTDTTAPVATADDVADTIRDIFKRIIGKAKRLATIENKTIISMGADLQESIDSFKCIIPKSDWWRQRADTISDFEARYRLAMNGRTPEAYKWLTCYHVHRLASDESKAILTTGRSGRPFPIATIDTIGAWLTYDKATDTWSIKDGYEDDLDAIILRVADDGLTAVQTVEAMKAIDSAHRLANAEATGGAKAKATEERALKAKAKADRTKALDGAMDKLAKAIESDTIGGASASEILNKLADRASAEATGLVSADTMSPTEALAFAQRLCELDRADVIFVILTRLRAYEANAMASDKSAVPPVGASLNESKASA